MAQADTVAPLASVASSAQKSPTSRRALEILAAADANFHVPTRAERQALLVGFAMRGKALYGAAYDGVSMPTRISLDNPQLIAQHVPKLTIVEVKSTNRAGMKEDLAGYFFNITTAELLVAQSLGEQYTFAFVNVVTGSIQKLDLAAIYAKARAIYPAWHIRF